MHLNWLGIVLLLLLSVCILLHNHTCTSLILSRCVFACKREFFSLPRRVSWCVPQLVFHAYIPVIYPQLVARFVSIACSTVLSVMFSKGLPLLVHLLCPAVFTALFLEDVTRYVLRSRPLHESRYIPQFVKFFVTLSKPRSFCLRLLYILSYFSQPSQNFKF